MGLIERFRGDTTRREIEARIAVLLAKSRTASARVADAQQEHDRFAESVLIGADSDLPKFHKARDALATALREQGDVVELLRLARQRLDNIGEAERAEAAQRHRAETEAKRAAFLTAVRTVQARTAALAEALDLYRDAGLALGDHVGRGSARGYPNLSGEATIDERAGRYVVTQLPGWTDTSCSDPFRFGKVDSLLREETRLSEPLLALDPPPRTDDATPPAAA